MLTPVPGLAHVKVWSPPTPRFRAPAPLPGSRQEAAALGPVVLLALQAAFGIRQLQSLPSEKFSATVRAQISARLRSSPVRGPVRLLRLHVRERGEVFGTAVCAQRLVAFTAVTDGERLTSFRVL